jgi:hypothetical protein
MIEKCVAEHRMYEPEGVNDTIVSQVAYGPPTQGRRL